MHLPQLHSDEENQQCGAGEQAEENTEDPSSYKTIESSIQFASKYKHLLSSQRHSARGQGHRMRPPDPNKDYYQGKDETFRYP
jgi:hypothetical protein